MPSKKISQLTAATTPLTGTEELPIVQGGITKKTTAQDIADLGGGGGATYTSYVAKLHLLPDEESLNVVFENTTGLPFTWASQDEGAALQTILGNVNPNKIFILLTSSTRVSALYCSYDIFTVGSSTYIKLKTSDVGEENSKMMVEIRLYP